MAWMDAAAPAAKTRMEQLGPPVVLGLALGVRALCWAEWRAWPGSRVPVLDAAWHMGFAERVVGGDLDGSAATWVVAPGLGYLFALARALGGDGTAPAALLLLACDLLAVELIRRLGARAAGPAAGLAAGLIAALSPNLVFHALGLLGVSPPLALLALSALLALGGAPAAALGSGLALGLSCWFRPNHLLLWPVLALVAAWPEGARAPARGRLRAAGMVALGLALALLPGLARNLAVSGDAVPISANAGANLYMAQQPGSWSVQLQPPPGPNNLDAMTAWFQREAEAARGRPLSPGEADRYWMERARANLAADPDGALERSFARAMVALATWSQHDHYAYDAHRRERPWLGRLPDPSWLLPGLAFVGAWLLWEGGRRREAVLLGGIVLGLALSAAPFGVVERYRLPGWAGLLPLAGAGLVLGLRAPRRLLWAPLVSLLLSVDPFVGRLVLPELLAGGPALSWSEHAGREREIVEATNVGGALVRAGMLEEALGLYDEALALDPGRAEALLARCGVLLALERPALQSCEAATRALPRAWESWYQLGLASLRAGDAGAARAALERARALAPENPRVDELLREIRVERDPRPSEAPAAGIDE